MSKLQRLLQAIHRRMGGVTDREVQAALSNTRTGTIAKPFCITWRHHD